MDSTVSETGTLDFYRSKQYLPEDGEEYQNPDRNREKPDKEFQKNARGAYESKKMSLDDCIALFNSADNK